MAIWSARMAPGPKLNRLRLGLLGQPGDPVGRLERQTGQTADGLIEHMTPLGLDRAAELHFLRPPERRAPGNLVPLGPLVDRLARAIAKASLALCFVRESSGMAHTVLSRSGSPQRALNWFPLFSE